MLTETTNTNSSRYLYKTVPTKYLNIEHFSNILSEPNKSMCVYIDT